MFRFFATGYFILLKSKYGNLVIVVNNTSFADTK